MLYRSLRSAVFIWLAVISLVLGFLMAGDAATARAADRSIRFEDLKAHASSGSPRARILSQELSRVQADRDNALQWSNPEIAYDHEELEPFREMTFTLSKSFERPFSHSKKREGWDDRVRAAELQLDQNVAGFLAELKTDYALLKLLDTYLAQLTQLEDIATRALNTAQARYAEGEISGVDKHLLQLSVLALDASRRDALMERRKVAARWKAEMGIPPGDEAILVTPISFKQVYLETPAKYVTMHENHPGVQSQSVLEQALGKQAEAAKPSLVPGFDLYVGYKHVEPVVDGWVAGAALSLPLFDRKAGAARRLEADRRIAENRLEIYRNQTSDEISALVLLIEDAGRALSSFDFDPDDGAEAINSLIVSYEEGQYSLEAFLNAIQIEVSGSRGYYDQLYTYYENIFRLEALTGAEIVSFSSQESE